MNRQLEVLARKNSIWSQEIWVLCQGRDLTMGSPLSLLNLLLLLVVVLWGGEGEHAHMGYMWMCGCLFLYFGHISHSGDTDLLISLMERYDFKGLPSWFLIKISYEGLKLCLNKNLCGVMRYFKNS